MSSIPADQPMEHEYDGIQEFDNPTPGWWHFLFGASVVFAVLYLSFWHASVLGWSVQDAWDDDQHAEFIRMFGSVGELKHDEPSILATMKNEQFMNIAKATFIGNCSACHKRDGGGDVGVNLCDDYYKNVKQVGDIFGVISDGANGGAMPSWKNRLSENERVILAAYVASLRGTTPLSPKAAEGNKIPPWPSLPGSPSRP